MNEFPLLTVRCVLLPAPLTCFFYLHIYMCFFYNLINLYFYTCFFYIHVCLLDVLRPLACGTMVLLVCQFSYSDAQHTHTYTNTNTNAHMPDAPTHLH